MNIKPGDEVIYIGHKEVWRLDNTDKVPSFTAKNFCFLPGAILKVNKVDARGCWFYLEFPNGQLASFPIKKTLFKTGKEMHSIQFDSRLEDIIK